MMRRAALLCLALVACRSSREVEYQMTWEVTNAGHCGAPGYDALKGQTELTLHFDRFPSYYEIICSTDLADRLTRMGSPHTRATFMVDGRGNHSTCAVGPIQARRLPKWGCDFPGAIVSGMGGTGAVDPHAPSPWD